MTDIKYPEPVSQLLALGDVRGQREWLDYQALGLTADHVPDLIRMTLDGELFYADSDCDEVWAGIHAWRALGQLCAVEAVEPLLMCFDSLDENMDDWISEEIPEVLGMIGPEAIPPVRDYLMKGAAHGVWPYVAAANALLEVAKRHPECRKEVVAILSAQLEHFAEQERTLNACIATDLVELHAVEAAPILERAYAADAVDLTMLGDWEDVQIELGLLDERLTPRPDYFALEMPEFAKTRDALGDGFTSAVREILAQESGELNSELDHAPKPVVPEDKPGRNDPCWCGSGKKYKHCHWREDRMKGL